MAISKREKKTLACLGAVAVLAAIYILTEKPIKEYQASKTRLEEARVRAQETAQWRKDIDERRAHEQAMVELIQNQGGKFDLYSFVNATVRKADIKDITLKRTNPRNFAAASALSKVELTLNSVNLKEIVDLIHTLYADEKSHVAVYEMKFLKPSRIKSKGLTCRLTLVSPK